MSYGGARAGTFNRKVDFYRQTDTQDESGQKAHGYVYHFSKMMDVTSSKGAEKTQSEREELAKVYLRFRGHFDSRLTVLHKAKFDGNYYDVQNFAPVGTSNRRVVVFTGELIDAINIVIEE